MSQVQIQQFIVQEIRVNHCAHFRKGQTIAKRDRKSKEKWTEFLIARGYSNEEAAVIFSDARDMAILELRATDAGAQQLVN
ncbi:hypothetical protein [Achromobacter spanius]|uniref:hypothetical protein n=1 Tax=Achromobacter spanius TaxID=217203 RepID=UPI0038010353